MPDVERPVRSMTNSEILWCRAQEVIPCGTQTLSKGPDQFVRGVYPIYLQRGEGCHVWDVDGNQYIDYPMALGPILLGYHFPAVHQAVTRQLQEGAVFTLMHPREVELAEMLVECIPCAEMVRFGKNGSDVTAAAVRVARAYTGREHIAFCGYHGWHDWYAVSTARNAGIPLALHQLMHEFVFNRIETLERIFLDHPGQVAAVIMEIGVVEPRAGFVQQVKDVAHRYGAVFILDEIVTGFRFALGGAQELYGVTPDLACFGKGMTNGFPLAAVVGTRELMKTFERVFFSMTYGGETLSIAAAVATIRVLRSEPVIPYIWAQGTALREGLKRVAGGFNIDLRVKGRPPWSSLTFHDRDGHESDLMKSLFMQECVKRGVLFGGPVFVTYSHAADDMAHTLDVAEHAMAVIQRGLDRGDLGSYLEGQPARTVFRPKSSAAEDRGRNRQPSRESTDRNIGGSAIERGDMMQVMVVGCGSIGRRHLLNLRELGVTRIIACDPDERARTALEGMGVRCYPDYHDALADHPHVAAAVIASPTSLHVAHARDLAVRGIHLLVEKPLSHHGQGIDDLIAHADEARIVAMMAMCYRFHPALMMLKTWVDEARIGRVYSVRIAGGRYLPDWHPDTDYRTEYAARASMGGGVLLTNLVHSLDAIRWVFGECDEVQFLVRTVGDLEIDTDDIAVGHLALTSGVVVQLYADFLQRNPQYRIEVIGQTGTIHWEYGGRAVWLYAGGDWHSFPCHPDPNDMYLNEMRAFLTCVARDLPSPVPLREGAKDMVVIEAMRQSSVERCIVRIAAPPTAHTATMAAPLPGVQPSTRADTSTLSGRVTGMEAAGVRR